MLKAATFITVKCFVRILRCLIRWRITAASSSRRRSLTLHRGPARLTVHCRHVRKPWYYVEIQQLRQTQLFHWRHCSHLQIHQEDLFLSTCLLTKVVCLMKTFINVFYRCWFWNIKKFWVPFIVDSMSQHALSEEYSIWAWYSWYCVLKKLKATHR